VLLSFDNSSSGNFAVVADGVRSPQIPTRFGRDEQIEIRYPAIRSPDDGMRVGVPRGSRRAYNQPDIVDCIGLSGTATETTQIRHGEVCVHECIGLHLARQG